MATEGPGNVFRGPMDSMQSIGRNISDRMGHLPSKNEVGQKLSTTLSRENLGKALGATKTFGKKGAGHIAVLFGSLAGSKRGGDAAVSRGMELRGKKGADTSKGIASYRRGQMGRSVKKRWHGAIRSLMRGIEAVAHRVVYSDRVSIKSKVFAVASSIEDKAGSSEIRHGMKKDGASFKSEYARKRRQFDTASDENKQHLTEMKGSLKKAKSIGDFTMDIDPEEKMTIRTMIGHIETIAETDPEMAKDLAIILLNSLSSIVKDGNFQDLKIDLDNTSFIVNSYREDRQQVINEALERVDAEMERIGDKLGDSQHEKITSIKENIQLLAKKNLIAAQDKGLDLAYLLMDVENKEDLTEEMVKDLDFGVLVALRKANRVSSARLDNDQFSQLSVSDKLDRISDRFQAEIGDDGFGLDSSEIKSARTILDFIRKLPGVEQRDGLSHVLSQELDRIYASDNVQQALEDSFEKRGALGTLLRIVMTPQVDSPTPPSVESETNAILDRVVAALDDIPDNNDTEDFKTLVKEKLVGDIKEQTPPEVARESARMLEATLNRLKGEYAMNPQAYNEALQPPTGEIERLFQWVHVGTQVEASGSVSGSLESIERKLEMLKLRENIVLGEQSFGLDSAEIKQVRVIMDYISELPLGSARNALISELDSILDEIDLEEDVSSAFVERFQEEGALYSLQLKVMVEVGKAL